MGNRPRIAVVSPFLDKQHGTERCVVEQVERLARDYEVHVYSNRVADVDPTSIFWHRVPALPGPHLLAYCWWFLANHLWRWWDRRFRGLRFDLTYTPGINCLDADVTAVHIVFAEFARLAREELRLRKASLRSWPRLIHRKIYYRLIIALEKRIYTRSRLTIVCVSSQVAREIALHYQRERDVYVIHNAVDHRVFDCRLRLTRREAARRELGLSDQDFVLLLVGNDWKKKGLHWLLEAMGRLPGLALKLLVVGRDDRAPYEPRLRELGIDRFVRFLTPSADIVRFYAASDVYVGPSLHDSFAFPPLEAMACGLPVITSARNGGAEIISHGTDGFVLQDPADIDQLTELIKRLHDDQELRRRLGDNGATTARQYTWERNAAQLSAIFQQAIERREAQEVYATQERQ